MLSNRSWLWLVVLVCSVLALPRGSWGQVEPQPILPDEARAAVEEYQKAAGAILEKAELQIEPIRNQAIGRLKAIQDKYTRAAKLEEAMAIRDTIRQILGIQKDPGSLHVAPEDIGKSMVFEVVGAVEGTIWGTEVYTSDSHLATIAVHMGLLKPGEKGLVRVRVLAGQKSYAGSTRNSVTSQSYGPWPASFTVERAKLPSF